VLVNVEPVYIEPAESLQFFFNNFSDVGWFSLFLEDTGPWMVVSVVSFAQMKPHLESWQS
jgi:hypothetical protein